MKTPRAAGTVQGSILVAQSVFPVMGAVLLVPVVPLLFREYGGMAGANYLIPMLLTVPGICIALLSPLFGWISDRSGRRPILIAAIILYGLSGIAPIFLTDFTFVLLSRVVLGLCDAVVVVVSAVMIGDYFEGERRAKWLALISTVSSIVAAVFLALGGALGEIYGWRGAVSAYALAFLFVPAMILFTWEPEAAAVKKREIGNDNEVILTKEEITGISRHLWIMGAWTAFGGVLFYALVLQQGLGFAALGTVDPGRLGMLTAIGSLGNPIGTLVFRRFTHVPTLVMLAVAFGLLAAGFTGIGSSTNDIMFTVAAFVGMFGSGLLMPTLLTSIMQPLSYEIRGRGSSVFHSTFAFGQFGSGFVIPFLAARLDSGALGAFAVLGGFALAAAIAVTTLHRMSPARRNRERTT